MPADPAKMAGTPQQPALALSEAELAAAGQGKGSRSPAMALETAAAAHPAETASKSDARSEFRAELASAQASQPGSAAAEARPAPAADAPPPPPAQQPATSAGSGPLSLVSDVAQKVAAQTSAPGSVVPVHAVAVAIAARANAGSTRFDIRLDPAELGRIEVSLTLDREGRVKSKIVAEKPETLELLQRDQRNLERTLNQAGLSTSEGSVEFSLKDQGGQGMQRERENPEGGPPAQAVVAAAPADVLTQLSAATYARLAAARGGIDIRI
ncbi:Flagellar hook-length control protein FliK [bacterium YEK0313]|nr:Flagellar hook-length control protein FliK [bacterium YEK0313]